MDTNRLPALSQIPRVATRSKSVATLVPGRRWVTLDVRLRKYCMAKKLKPFTDYIESWSSPGVRRYSAQPGTEFLDQILDIADAISHCRRNFSKKKNGEFTRPSYDSMTHVSAGCHCTIMGHFELFQRFTFAGLVENSLYLDGFELESAVRRLGKDFNLQIDPARILAYRGSRATAGQLVVDSLAGWHDPERVNRYFKALLPKLNFYSNDQVDDLRVLWQVRHTMAHTGGWLSIPDAQKVEALQANKNHALFLKAHFTEAVVRRFHKIVPACVMRLKDAFDVHGEPEFAATDQYKMFFKVTSKRKSWL